MSSYRHTEVGYGLIAGLGVLMVAMLVLARVEQALAPASLIAPVVLGLAILLFPTLTTAVKGNCVRCSYGLGLVRRTVAVQEIAEMSIVRSHWMYGWGVRKIPRGWLWNIGSLTAVELRLRSGSVLRIGTDDAEGLRQALSARLSAL